MKKTIGFWPLFIAPIFLAIGVWQHWEEVQVADIYLIYAIGTTVLAAFTLYAGFAMTHEQKFKYPTVIGGAALALAALVFWAISLLPNFFQVVFVPVAVAAGMAVILGYMMTSRITIGILVAAILWNAVQYFYVEEFTDLGIGLLVIAVVLVALDYFGVFRRVSPKPKAD